MVIFRVAAVDRADLFHTDSGKLKDLGKFDDKILNAGSLLALFSIVSFEGLFNVSLLGLRNSS